MKYKLAFIFTILKLVAREFSLFANAKALQHEKAFVSTEKLAYPAGDSIRIE